MPEYGFGPWPMGMDMLSDKRELRSTKKGTVAVRDAENISFTVDGHAASRPSFERIIEGNCHSLFSTGGQLFFVKDGVLMRYADGQIVSIFTLEIDEPLSYCVLNGELIFSGSRQMRVYGPSGIRPICPPAPAGLNAQGVSGGGLDAGRYAIAAAYQDEFGEGPMSPVSFVDVEANGGIAISAQAGMNLYRSLANGDILYRVLTPGALIGNGPVGMQAVSHGLDQLPPGEIVRFWRGHLVTARANTIYFSEPFRYGVTSLAYGFMRFPSGIRFLEPVDGGLYVGQSDGVLFLSGNSQRELTVNRTDSAVPISRSAIIMKSSDLYPMEGVNGETVVWLTEKGYSVGLASGQVLNMQSSRIRLSGSRAQTVLAGDKIVSIIQ
jgi:hypothetical protein